MTGRSLAILIIDDDAGWALLVREMLADVPARLTHRASLREGIAALHGAAFDAVLLDLHLTDSTGLDTMRALRAETQLPIVVLSGHDMEHEGGAEVQLSAEDYIRKSDAQAALLWWVILHAVERHRWRLREHERHEQEVSSVERLAGEQPGTSLTGRLLGAVRPLREGHPDEFARFVETYSALLARALEERLYQIEPNVAAKVPELAHAMGRLLSGPRDVLDVHTVAVKTARRGQHLPGSQALMEEARILVLSLMGHLAGYYRNYVPSSKARSA